MHQVFYGTDNGVWTPQEIPTSSINSLHNNLDVDTNHVCAAVVHPETSVMTINYTILVKDQATWKIWQTAFGKEFGNLAQWDRKTGKKGTNSVFVMTHEEITLIPKDQTVTYGRVVVDYYLQKKDPNRVQITAGDNLIKYPGELMTITADLVTSKLLWNSILSTDDARFMGIDIKSFYLKTPLDRYEYMKMPLDISPLTLSSNITSKNTPKMAKSTLRSAKRFTASHKQTF